MIVLERCLYLTLVAAFVPALPARGSPLFLPLGNLGGSSAFSKAYAVSADGSTVVGASGGPSGGEAFRWTSETGMVGLGDLSGDGFSGEATAVSADGSIVVGRSDGSVDNAFRWTLDGGMVALGHLPGASLGSYAADGISADGSVIVGSSPGRRIAAEAVRWTDSGITGLGDLPGGLFPYSFAYAVSADGSTIVGWGDTDRGTAAFRWTESEGMLALEEPDPNEIVFGNYASAVSADGSVIVGTKNKEFFGEEAFRWTVTEGMVGLGDLPGGTSSSSAYGISADGSTVVGFGTSGSGAEATIWSADHGLRELDQVLASVGIDLTGWTLAEARGVSSDGRTIVGWGTNPLGEQEAWLARVPEPGSIVLITLGLAGLALRNSIQRS